MFDSHVDSFRNDSISDLLVYHNTDGARIDIEDSACAAVIVLVWHTFMDSSINYNINDISNSVCSKCFRDVDSSMLFESLFKFMSGSSFVAVAVGHDGK